jgi:hypothetical protein
MTNDDSPIYLVTDDDGSPIEQIGDLFQRSAVDLAPTAPFLSP